MVTNRQPDWVLVVCEGCHCGGFRDLPVPRWLTAKEHVMFITLIRPGEPVPLSGTDGSSTSPGCGRDFYTEDAVARMLKW